MTMRSKIVSEEQLRELAGKPVDIADWSYIWRRDRRVQEYPEACFIPRRLKRQDKIYRTALDVLGPEKTESLFYKKQDDVLKKQLPEPAFPLLTGALWVGCMKDYTVTLTWEEGRVPDLSEVEVRTYPTAWGWFGWTVDLHLESPELLDGGRRWVYQCPKGLTMDLAYNSKTPSATEMIAVFAPESVGVPEISVTGGSLGEWKPLEFTVSWGIGGCDMAFDGKWFSHVAPVGSVEVDAENKRARVSCLYSMEGRYGFDSRFTFVSSDNNDDGATVLLRELAEKPIYVPETGLFFSSDPSVTPEKYLSELENSGAQNIRTRVRAHKEAEDWEENFRKVRLWRCEPGTKLNALPIGPEPQFKVSVPDKNWEAMYRHAIEQLRGRNMWGTLSSEVGRVTLSMEFNGLYQQADNVYGYFLRSPGVKCDGDYLEDASGSFEWAEGMRHDICYSHEGSHCSPGKILFSMAHRWYLTGDREWLDARIERMKAAADWIIRERRSYLKELPEREKLHVAGLMPPLMFGDYALPYCDWRWYYSDDAYAYMGVDAVSKLLEDIGEREAAAYYRSEAEDFKKDLLAAVRREALLAPVRRGSDGCSRSFIPRMAYAGGLMHYGEETNIPQFAMGINDLFQGALPLSEIGGPLDPLDRRMVGTLDAMEESGTAISLSELKKLEHPTAGPTHEKQDLTEDTSVAEREEEDPSEHWFWNSFSNLPKISHNANIYLRQDDIPNFLRYLFNHAIMMVGTNGKFWEHAHPTVYTECMDPDNGTSGWFAECFRDMLATEDNGVLWLAKGTPRAWLRQGEEISVAELPTFYGKLTYTVSSDVDNRRITAEIALPQRKALSELRLRLRHPEGARISSAEVKGGTASVAPDGETVVITGFGSDTKLSVTALY